MWGCSRIDFAAMVVRWGIPALRSLETVAGFLKLVELCKGLVVLPCLISSVEMNVTSRPMAIG
jgi:hypothetical protein